MIYCKETSQILSSISLYFAEMLKMENHFAAILDDLTVLRLLDLLINQNCLAARIFGFVLRSDGFS